MRALAGDRSITVSWDAVTDTGGYPVQEYRARISIPHPTNPGTLLVISRDPAATSVTFNNLTNGTAYFNVRVTVLTGPSFFELPFAVETSLGSSYILTPSSATLDPQAFITTWRTSVKHQTITIPTNSDYTYDYSVDWGDATLIPALPAMSRIPTSHPACIWSPSPAPSRRFTSTAAATAPKL